MAQNSHREKGDFSVDAGLGLGTINDLIIRVIPPIKIDAEYTILTFGAGSLSIGGYSSLATYRLDLQRLGYDYKDLAEYNNMKFTYFLVGPMATIRYALTDSVDIFGKLVLGYLGISSSDTLVNEYVKGGYATGGAYIGGTWYFSPKVGIGGEVGIGAPTNLGIHLTFKI
jgi:hypothetical protein